jgi:hypothetical protein
MTRMTLLNTFLEILLPDLIQVHVLLLYFLWEKGPLVFLEIIQSLTVCVIARIDVTSEPMSVCGYSNVALFVGVAIYEYWLVAVKHLLKALSPLLLLLHNLLIVFLIPSGLLLILCSHFLL